MPKQDKPFVTADIEKVYLYDHSRDCYTTEFWRKGGTQDEEHILSVCLPDGENESDWGEPFVEGDKNCIPPEMLKDVIEELKQWREQTGDHLKLFT